MLNASNRTASVSGYLLDGIMAVCAAFASVALFTWVLSELAVARFWEPWVTRFGVLGSGIPFAFVALISGFVVGAAVGLVFGHRALRVAALAGVFAALAWLIGTATYPDGGSLLRSSVIAAATLAIGLVMGSICTRRIRHA